MDKSLSPFILINKHTGNELTRKEILELAVEKGFFENEFSSYDLVLKRNGTPVIYGINPMVSFSLNKEDYLLRWLY